MRQHVAMGHYTLIQKAIIIVFNNFQLHMTVVPINSIGSLIYLN